MLEAEVPDREDAIPADVLLEGSRPLPEVTEALIGACFVAFGFDRTALAVTEAFEARIEHAAETRVDFKSALQELLAQRQSTVAYEVIAESGPAHARTFEVAAIVGSDRVGTGVGRSKKAAEQVAAERALKKLGD
jgi:ribonuclease-3